MDDSGINEGGTTGLLKRLRPLIGDLDAAPAPDWRADLRLFAFTWTAGFLFFLLVIA